LKSVLHNQLGRFTNIVVQWVPGASPTVTLFDAQDEPIAKNLLTDMDLNELKALLLNAGLEIAFPVVPKPTGPPDATGEFGELRYELYVTKNDFKNAKEFAESLTKEGFGKGRLFTVACEAQNNYIKQFLIQNDVENAWLGATDSEAEGEWKWIDGPLEDRVFWIGRSDGTLIKGLYANWRGGEPNNVDIENCATIQLEFDGWNDAQCEGILASILVEFGNPRSICPETVTIETQSTNPDDRSDL